MTNDDIAAKLHALADLLEVHGENPFKTKAYHAAADTIEEVRRPVAEFSDADWGGLRGIGEAIRARIDEMLRTGSLRALDELATTTPPGVLEMLRVKGLGPKKIASVWKGGGIEDLVELEAACKDGRLAALKGFGAKTAATVLDAVRFYQEHKHLFRYNRAEVAAAHVMEALRTALPSARFEATGELRRQLEIMAAVDVCTDAPEDELRTTLLGLGIEMDDAATGLQAMLPAGPPVVFHTGSSADFYARLFRSTGPEAFVAAIEGRGSFPAAPATEAELFTAVGLPYIEPARRDDPEVLGDPVHAAGPSIDVTDLRGLIHSHSTWSDGGATVEEMARGAMARGLQYLVMSDHSAAAGYANGLTPDRVAAQHSEIEKLNAILAPFRIFKSIESDILADGALDYNPRVLQTFDVVIASVHSNLTMAPEKAMQRLLAAIRNPYTSILGHPTGRLLLARRGYSIDHETIIAACAEQNVVIEINANPHRLDLDWRWIRRAVEAGVTLSINPDSHSVHGMDDNRYGVLVAQKGGLLPAQNLSSFSLSQFTEWLGVQHRKRPA